MPPTTKATQARPSRSDGRKAFTLIELLVVIAIISLLVSILLPSLQKAKELAKGVVCSSNLRGLTTSLLFYAQDHRQVIPPYWVGAYSGDYAYGGSTWYMKLTSFGYVEDDRNADNIRVNGLFWCPSGEPNSPEAMTYDGQKYGMRVFWRWETAGIYKTEDESPGGQYGFHSINNIDSPGAFFIFADSVNSDTGKQNYAIQIGGAGSPHIHGAHARHVDLANAGFLDGHVTGQPAEYFSRLHEDPTQAGYTTNGSGTTRQYAGYDQSMTYVP